MQTKLCDKAAVIARKHTVHLLARSLPRCLENSRYDICVNVEERPIRGHGMSTMHWARNRTLCAVHLHSVPGTSFDGHPRQIKCIAFYFTLADNLPVPPVDYYLRYLLLHELQPQIVSHDDPCASFLTRLHSFV